MTMLTRSIKYTGLIAGIILIFLSFLFFGRQHRTYQNLLLGGLATAFIFYLTIVIGKEQLKSKLIWTVVIAAAAVVQWLAAPFLIGISYRCYINQHISTLTDINGILRQKKGDVFILNDSVTSRSDTLRAEEKQKLIKGREEIGVYMISKSGNKVYYGLWGFLDVRLGIIYFISKKQPGDKYRHLTGNWYY